MMERVEVMYMKRLMWLEEKNSKPKSAANDVLWAAIIARRDVAVARFEMFNLPVRFADRTGQGN
jgi:hypothetical protein